MVRCIAMSLWIVLWRYRLSFTRPMFDYIGGYPEQPLIEDYEVTEWLRLRSVLLSTIYNSNSNSNNNIISRAEHLVLLRDRAKCSPRRRQKYGVAYTSLVDALCICRYRRNATAFYYHCNNISTANKKQTKLE